MEARFKDVIVSITIRNYSQFTDINTAHDYRLYIIIITRLSLKCSKI